MTDIAIAGKGEKTMPRYIDAEKIKYTEYINGDVTVSKDLVEKIPTADVQKVKHAKNLCEDYPSLFECSLCRWCDDDTTTGSTSVYNYCPNCGAKMDGGKHEI